MTAKLSICVVDDEKTIRLSLERLFAGNGHEMWTASTGAEAVHIAEQQAPDVFLLDLVLPDIDGIEVLRRIKRVSSDSAVVMISAHGDVTRTVDAMKEGADNFVTKPVDLHRLEALVETVGKVVRAEREIEYYRTRRSGCVPFIGVSKHAQQVLQLIGLLADNVDTTVLLTGESGTGKGVVAALIHERSERCSRPLVEVSCAELTLPLLESELFGHERGAFTDAKQRKKGLLQVADRGTLFLDEIGELDLTLQPKLLKVLEGRTFRRVGGVRDIDVDVRIVAATNVDMQAMVTAGAFREDLYYRLNVMPIRLVPLRERPEDIGPLVEHFLAEGTTMKRRRVRTVNDNASDMLRSYPWPGNVRELRNVLERATILASGEVISPAELPSEIHAMRGRASRPPCSLPTLEENERELIAETLAACGGNRTHSAKGLGISRSTLLEKMKRYRMR